jgi:hypothetical protein
MKRTLFFIFVLALNFIFSQDDKVTSSFTISDDVKILDEQLFYRNYFSEYKLNENWYFRAGIEERSNSNLLNSYTLMEFPLLFKYSLNNKLSVLFGPKVDVLKVDSEIGGVSLFSTFGLQYNFTEDFSIEGKVNYNLTNGEATNTNYLGSDFVVYKIGTKLRF